MYARYFPSAYEESLAKALVDCAYAVHNTLGPGLLEQFTNTASAMSFISVIFPIGGKCPFLSLMTGISCLGESGWMCLLRTGLCAN
jgi:hypothetical protein